jgi:hypothetical protein
MKALNELLIVKCLFDLKNLRKILSLIHHSIDNSRRYIAFCVLDTKINNRLSRAGNPAL